MDLYLNFTCLLPYFTEIRRGNVDTVSPGVCKFYEIPIVRSDRFYDILKAGSAL
jgi:hypothetical protein